MCGADFLEYFGGGGFVKKWTESRNSKTKEAV
jgi:hypothetical protein